MTLRSVPLSSVVVVNPRGWTDPPSPEESVSFVRMAAVEAGSGKLDSSHHRPWSEVSKGYTKFEEGDVLFAKITPSMENGKAALATGLAGGRGVGSTEFHVLRPTGCVNPRYLLHFVLQEQFRRDARAQMRGVAGQLRVPPEFFNDVQIPVPPLDEQKQIVDEIETQLARLDDAVASLQRARTRLKRYRASVLKAACEGSLVPTEAELARQEGRDYEPASVLLDRIKAERDANANGKRRRRKKAPPLDASSLPDLPEGWAWTTLPEVGQMDRGKSRHRPRNDARLYGGLYPFIQTAEVRASGGVIDTYRQTYSDFGLSQSKLWPAGTLCITIAANIAETGILSFDACFPDSIVGFKLDSCAGNTKFIEAFLRTEKDNLARLAPATAQRNINLSTLGVLPIPFPPHPEQERIVAEVERRLSILDQLESTVDTNFKRAEALRQSILREAFSGQLASAKELEST